MWARLRPVAASMGSDQSRLPVSSQSVPAASDMSLTASPVSRRRNQSLGSSTRRVRLNTSGSCSRTHDTFGAVKPGMARLPVMLESAGLRG